MTFRLPFLPLLTVRAVAVLMLLAGVSVGVLLARTLWAGRVEPPPGPVLDAAIEQKVQLYVRYGNLDPGQADRVRRCLTRLDREVLELYRQLRQEQAPRFQALRVSAEEELAEILEEARGAPRR